MPEKTGVFAENLKRARVRACDLVVRADGALVGPAPEEQLGLALGFGLVRTSSNVASARWR